MTAYLADVRYGIRANLGQFTHQLVQVLFVGLTLGLFRTVVPALAESDFGVAKGSFMMLTAFVTAFGFVKGAMNFVAGRLSERIGRKKVLFLGWLVALPIPFMILHAPSWDWIVAATVLLGVNQGLAWSMTQTSKLDLTTADQRGLTIGLNEFAGYFGVALAGIATGYLATHVGAREGLMLFGSVVVLAAGLLTLVWVHDTLPWAQAEARQHAAGGTVGPKARYPRNIADTPDTWAVFTLMSWRDTRMASISQAGLVEKFVDALVWVFFPVYLYQRGLSLAGVGWVVGVYGFVWGLSQFLTGHWSDRVGRKKPIVAGMWLCSTGVALVLLGEGELWWSFAAAVMGFGMALLYPTLSAAVSDIAHPNWRGSAIGIYRFWRDTGYGVGALLLGLVASAFGRIEAGFWFTAVAMFVSGLVVLLACEETHPRLNPARS
ncbi:MAG: MFS transporter [Hydrogenophilales bacterium 16-64-46]|nr:MAG: MFS transporter [Hydrogenophilales bacterium 12-64-13]OYZ07198.1 MAG: MFS transporter [Hydrogenophilales bacterium 16-64-46]OZA37334.1 MAG: MFS transporter [Hydrogenophilales bacterium 17-64-34]HQT00649.1 MFS transporter [Thiobacillus sp.]